MFGWEKKVKGKIVKGKIVKGKKVKGKWEESERIFMVVWNEWK